MKKKSKIIIRKKYDGMKRKRLDERNNSSENILFEPLLPGIAAKTSKYLDDEKITHLLLSEIKILTENEIIKNIYEIQFISTLIIDSKNK